MNKSSGHEQGMGNEENLKSDLLSVVDYIRWAVSRFNEAELSFGHGTDNALDEAIARVPNG